MIAQHEHMWVPWNARRLDVCDVDDCYATVSWDQPGIYERDPEGVKALRCRVEVLAGEPLARDLCSHPAAVGIVTVSGHIEREVGDPLPQGPGLSLFPVCTEHVVRVSGLVSLGMDRGEWTIVSLAYGGSQGDLT